MSYLLSIPLNFGFISLISNNVLNRLLILVNVTLSKDSIQHSKQLIQLKNELNMILVDFTDFSSYKVIIGGEMNFTTIAEYENFQKEYSNCFDDELKNIVTNQKLQIKDQYLFVNKNYRVLSSEYLLHNIGSYPNDTCPSTHIPLVSLLCNVTEKEYYSLKHSENFSTDLIPHLWLPNWVSTNEEPSATVLSNYKQTQ